MVKIKRYTLQQLQNNYPSLSADELKELIGGTRYEYSNYGIHILDDEGNLVQFLSYNYCEDQYGEDWMYDGFSVDGGSDFEDLEILPIASPSEGTSGSGETEGLECYMSERSILSRLTPQQMKIMDQMGIKIVRTNNLPNNVYGQYNAGENTIYLLDSNQYYNSDGEYDAFSHELIHAYQDYLEQDLNSTSCIEFQTRVINEIMKSYNNQGAEAITFVDTDHQADAANWIHDITHGYDSNIPLDMTLFNQRISEFYNYFLYGNTGTSYGTGVNYNYQYNWDSLFSIMGIKH